MMRGGRSALCSTADRNDRSTTCCRTCRPCHSRVGIGGPVDKQTCSTCIRWARGSKAAWNVTDGSHGGRRRAAIARGAQRRTKRFAKHVRFFVGYSGWGRGPAGRSELERACLAHHPAQKRRSCDAHRRTSGRSTLRGMGPRITHRWPTSRRTPRSTEHPGHQQSCRCCAMRCAYRFVR
jgi:hypothetical protein